MNTRLAIVLTTGLVMAGFVHSLYQARYGSGPKHRIAHTFGQAAEWATWRGTEACVTKTSAEAK